MKLLKKIVLPIKRQFFNLFQMKKEVPRNQPTRLTQLLELEALRKRNALREQKLDKSG